VVVLTVLDVAVVFVAAVVGSVSAPPSASERLSSTSTVCVIASVPVVAGCGGAGAIVSVALPVAAVSRLPHAAAASVIRTAISTTTKRVAELFTDSFSPREFADAAVV
jgi:hypothetical protein